MKKLMWILIIALMAMFAHPIYTQIRFLYELTAEEQTLLSELEKESETLARLKRENENVMSHSYVEKIAREKLGLVHQDEIVFINDNAR